MLAAGVPLSAFAREVGMSEKDLNWLAGRPSRKTEGEETLFWERVTALLNRKLGEIMEVRIKIEGREQRVRIRKVLARMGRGHGR